MAKNLSKCVKITGIEFREEGISFNIDGAVGIVNAIKKSMGDELALTVKPDGSLGYTQTR